MNNYKIALPSSNPLFSQFLFLSGLSFFFLGNSKTFSGASAMILQTGFSLPTTTTTTTLLSPCCSPHRLNTLFFTHRRRQLVSPSRLGSCFSKRRFSLCGTFASLYYHCSSKVETFTPNLNSSSFLFSCCFRK